MNEWLDLLKELLNDGVTLHIDIKIQREHTDKPYPVTCQYCGWTNRYDDPGQARRGLRAHQQHCAAYARQSQDAQWIKGYQGQELPED